MEEDIKKVEGFKEMDDRLFPEFRQKVYEYIKSTLSSVMTEDELDIVIKLMSMIFGDLYMRSKKLPWEIDVDKVPEEHLKPLSSIIGYRWVDGLTAEQQREGIKLFCLIRRNRGTNFGLTNLIRVFGQDSKKFYSSSDLRRSRSNRI